MVQHPYVSLPEGGTYILFLLVPQIHENLPRMAAPAAGGEAEAVSWNPVVLDGKFGPTKHGAPCRFKMRQEIRQVISDTGEN